MKPHLLAFARTLRDSLRDLAPIFIVIAFFQLVVLRQPIPELEQILFGSLLVVVGLTLFVQGLRLGLFPVGENMAYAFARKGSVTWLLLFAFALGFGTTVAEPALIAVASKASAAAAEAGLVTDSEAARYAYAWGLRITVGLAVGVALVVGVLRILRGWPMHVMITAAYLLMVAITPFAPREIMGIAYDFGAVTTSEITVPLVAALGVGLASSITGRNPLVDGFGLVAFASVMPMIFVMVYGILG
ncbi:membrane protein [Thiohalobacter sp. COW1]|uniref:DUF1538 domain-containing protein n=1 Tax=Thiohalobacter thiocyanaticus TaxID=585455 RepID=A0A1Z4VP18_9GAMM|nr:DUF1538 domain-containing protein [Thiohalobacter thiocyanaticus]BAZ93351.1 uncharacterized protein FOKN1_0951 [Thiohalobacter thiocyanaticus]BCO31606.1 membrane protein [Thiohalobacter sp. COW1]